VTFYATRGEPTPSTLVPLIDSAGLVELKLAAECTDRALIGRDRKGWVCGQLEVGGVTNTSTETSSPAQGHGGGG
jgi:hypothetical protein